MTDVPYIDAYLTFDIPDGHWIDQWNREVWVKDGGWHRTDGPTIIWEDGEMWWHLNHNRYYAFEDWLKANDYITDSQKVLLKLKYG